MSSKTRLHLSAFDSLFIYDSSPLEGEVDRLQSVPLKNGDSLSFTTDMSGRITSGMSVTSAVQHMIEQFTYPYYMSVLEYDMNSQPLGYVKVCNNCHATVTEAHETQHTEYHRKQHDKEQELLKRMAELHAPVYVVGLDPAAGTGTWAGGDATPEGVTRSQVVGSPDPGDQQESAGPTVQCERSSCRHNKRFHTKGGSGCIINGCRCTRFTLLPV